MKGKLHDERIKISINVGFSGGGRKNVSDFASQAITETLAMRIFDLTLITRISHSYCPVVSSLCIIYKYPHFVFTPAFAASLYSMRL